MKDLHNIKRALVVIVYIVTWLAIPCYIYQHPPNSGWTIRDRVSFFIITTIFCVFVPATLYTILEFIKNTLYLILNYIKTGNANTHR